MFLWVAQPTFSSSLKWPLLLPPSPPRILFNHDLLHILLKAYNLPSFLPNTKRHSSNFLLPLKDPHRSSISRWTAQKESSPNLIISTHYCKLIILPLSSQTPTHVTRHHTSFSSLFKDSLSLHLSLIPRKDFSPNMISSTPYLKLIILLSPFPWQILHLTPLSPSSPSYRYYLSHV